MDKLRTRCVDAEVPRLESTLNEVSSTFTPVPPPLRIRVDKAPTFAVDLSKMLVVAPEYWDQMAHLKELIGHEVKHASGDGLPYTYREAVRHEAHVMERLGVPLKTARVILNVVYDAVVDYRLSKEGLDVRGMCEEWLQRFPVTPQSEGSSYHLLHIIYKDWFGAPLEESHYEEGLRRNPEFAALKAILERLASAGELRGDCVQEVVRAAELIARLSRVEETPLGVDVDFDRGDPNVRAEAAEAGLELGLNDAQLAELMGVGEDELEKALEEAAEDKARTALWSKTLGFRELSTAPSLLELREPASRRWKPYSKRVDPLSVARAPGDPRKWREPVTETVAALEQDGESGGFSKLILLLDCSGSTAAFYEGRSVLGYIKDAAYGLIAYAKRFGLPVASIAFQSTAWVNSRESRNYVEHAKKVFLLRPGGDTNLKDAVSVAMSLKPERALIALLTDGLVDPDHLELFAKQSGANRLVAATVSVGGGVETVKRVGDRVQLFIVKPGCLGKTVVEALPGAVNRGGGNYVGG